MSSATLRVATWNVRGLRAGVEAVATAVRAEAPDVLLIQESGSRRRVRALGAALGMVVCADPPSFPRRRIKNAVLVQPPLRMQSHRMVRFAGGSLLYPRGALVAYVDDGLAAVSTHLGLSGPERGRHIGQLLSLVGGSPAFVIGGDLNALPEEQGPAAIAANAPDCWDAVGEGDGTTFPSDAPTARIDYLFAGPPVQPLRVWTAGGTVSDHLMVVADLRLVV